MNSLGPVSSAVSPAPGVASPDASTSDPSGRPFAEFLTSAESDAVPPGDTVGDAHLAFPAMEGLQLTGTILPPTLTAGSDLPLAPVAQDPVDQSNLSSADLLVAPLVGTAQTVVEQPAATAAHPVSASPLRSSANYVSHDQSVATQTGARLTPSAALASSGTDAGDATATVPGGPAVTVLMDAEPALNKPRESVRSDVAMTKQRDAAFAPSPAAKGAELARLNMTDTGGEREAQPRLAPVGLTTTTPSEGVASPWSAASLAPTASPAAASALQQPAAMQDLSAIIDRFAAAREAASPATASVALDHAEFGEMTLRFEQRQDGQLSVGLSSGNADAHRAIAAALATERNPMGGDRPASDSQHQGAQPRANHGSTEHADREDSNGQRSRPNSERNQQYPQGVSDTPISEKRTGGIYA